MLTFEFRIRADEVDDTCVGLLCVNIMLNIDSLQDILRWELLDLTIGN